MINLGSAGRPVDKSGLSLQIQVRYRPSEPASIKTRGGQHSHPKEVRDLCSREEKMPPPPVNGLGAESDSQCTWKYEPVMLNEAGEPACG